MAGSHLAFLLTSSRTNGATVDPARAAIEHELTAE